MLSARRIAAIRASEPSIHALNRAYDDGARDLDEAREWVWTRRIELAERHDRGDHYCANNYGRRVERFADMDPAMLHFATAGIPPLDHRPEDQADCLHLADLYSSSGQPPAGEPRASAHHARGSTFHLIAAE